MSDNIIQFQRPKKPKPPRQVPPWLRRVLVIAAVVAALALVWVYFYLTGSGTLTG
jgi:hypothetical protein